MAAAAAATRQVAGRRMALWLWLAAAGLGAYVVAGASQWWKLYNSKGWE